MQWQVVEVDGKTMFALTARGYEALSRTMADTVRWVREASWQLDFYRADRMGNGKEVPK